MRRLGKTRGMVVAICTGLIVVGSVGCVARPGPEGTRPKIDVTRAQVDLANAELAMVRARNSVAVTFAALDNAIGCRSIRFTGCRKT
jgi:hypothetical protein